MNEGLLIVIPLISGFVLDMVLGDPLWLPHPIRLFGNAIFLFEQKLNRNTYIKLKGVFTSVILISATWGFFFLLIQLSRKTELTYYLLASVFVFYGLANRSLIQEAIRVNLALEREGIEAAREKLAFIVGRDTLQLNGQQIRIAILETLAENLSDGVIAPLFFYALGGVPLMMAYKMANTLDSMIGYKNQHYKDFGWFAARLDDTLNFIPARLTALLMILVTFNTRGLAFIFKYGSKHSSPNAGYPEAALAGILNCRFGGANIYHGKIVEKPYIGHSSRLVTTKDIRRAARINFLSCLLFMGLIILLYKVV
ncbi:Adenosylcobinamide-phosphate synthase [hydrothermal vent metagenome]|uniref:Adenosylcobinamide-phosphate synthase n=1 Tax=hydrothermal vent metagenome TaxID=652676 RepID=A0A3B0T5L9_9ZZZZ